jgi:hypothetical protein
VQHDGRAGGLACTSWQRSSATRAARTSGARYDDACAALPVTTFAVPDGTVHARHLYTILIDGRRGLSRDEVSAALDQLGVATSVHFPAVHLHSYYARRYGFRRGQFPHAERIADQVLSLPLSPALSDEQVEAVVAAFAPCLELAMPHASDVIFALPPVRRSVTVTWFARGIWPGSWACAACSPCGAAVTRSIPRWRWAGRCITDRPWPSPRRCPT